MPAFTDQGGHAKGGERSEAFIFHGGLDSGQKIARNADASLGIANGFLRWAGHGGQLEFAGKRCKVNALISR